MTYYSETLQSPVSADYISSQYGINPAAEPGRLAGLGIYPLDEAPNPIAYQKVGDRYKTISSPVSAADMEVLAFVRKHHAALKAMVTPQWSADDTYAVGDEVQHKGKFYRKADDADNSPPDDVPGGWITVYTQGSN